MTLIRVILVIFTFLQLAVHGLLHHRYIIVGGGPAGLQMAHWMEGTGMDYIVFEKNKISGEFFLRYPRHKRLISFNRKGSERSDWNSLLQNSSKPKFLFSNVSNDLYPQADHMVQYLNTFASHHSLKVQYNTHVTSITPLGEGKGFEIEYSQNGENAKSIAHCDYVLVATGTWIPNQPMPYKGGNLIQWYHNLTLDPEIYRNKEVLVFGGGNSAMEIVDWLQSHAAHVHLAVRHPIFLAHSTHYEGDVRSINSQILDKYQLKSLDAITASMFFEGGNFLKKGDRIFIDDTDRTSEHRRGYHHVIACFGMTWDRSIFRKIIPKSTKDGKYPILTSAFESVNVKGMYFLGTLMHMRDYKRTGGGSIHGFRYFIRTLFHLIRHRHDHIEFPFTWINSTDSLLPAILNRERASSLFLMFGTLTDVFVPQTIETPQGTVWKHYEDIPIDMLNSTLKFYPFLPQSTDGQPIVFYTLTIKYNTDIQPNPPESEYIKSRRIIVDQDPDIEYSQLQQGNNPTSSGSSRNDGTEDLVSAIMSRMDKFSKAQEWRKSNTFRDSIPRWQNSERVPYLERWKKVEGNNFISFEDRRNLWTTSKEDVIQFVRNHKNL